MVSRALSAECASVRRGCLRACCFSSGNHGGRFDLDLRFVFDQRDNLHRAHRDVVVADQLAKRAADVLQRGEIFALVGHVPREAHEMLGLAAGFAQHGDDVLQRLLRLRGEVVGMETAPVRPSRSGRR